MKEPQRMCVCCRKSQDKRNLFRVVRTIDGQVVLDNTHKLNGRGAYVCKASCCVQKAQKSGVLSRQLKVPVPKELLEEMQKQVSE